MITNEEGTLRNYFLASVLLCLIVLLSGCNLVGYTSEKGGPKDSRTKVISEGTAIEDLDLSGTPVSEAPLKIKNWAKDKLEETRVLLYNDTEIPVALKEIGIEVDTRKMIEEAQLNPGKTLPCLLKVDPLAASQKLQERLKKFNKPAKDASYKIEKDKVVIRPAQSGRSVAVDQLIRQIQSVPLSEVPTRIDIPMENIPAKVTTESVKALAFDSIIGEFSTNFSVGEINRSANLAAAAKALDRKLLRPGQTLSFNETVGPREPETGYKDAYVIINGEYVKGTGGGVCQVSSTLYNAVLLSNLEILERMPHAMVISYVPPGQDATVNYPNIDFKFKNNTGSLVYLRTEVKQGVLTVRIWGKKTGKSVRIEHQVEKEMAFKTIRKYDPKLPSGRVIQDQKGSKGMVVNTWQIVRDAKGHETKQFLGRDWYAPTNRILRVGT
ncbi:VanW family protein [Desulfosporosinus sp.]|uniref:VanW family protein n=1 Tax=Desulfosporosinus sp. TaxID=157907 RepID=UPI000E935091|nr:VanW family protein [Desulfosporosinus sp.]MBC2721792.1 VanW family protein [Desulfosporosinus sp.]MBC2726925.1 VanW family protein [Desulfosporosinus sp.]HBV88996.1 vancomycin resistance protein [Desulfosporosinus sp.]